MAVNSLDRQIVAALRHLETLRARALSAPDQHALLEEALAELTNVVRALRESEARTRAIVDAAADGIITIDEQGQIESFNPAAERLFGYRAEELIGQNVKVLVPAPYADEHDDYLGRYRRTGTRTVIGIGREVVGRRKDGTIFPLELAVSEVRIDGHRLFTGILHDMTARKHAEEALRDSEARFQVFMNHSPALAWMKDEGGRYVYMNPALEQFFGATLAECRGRTDWDMLPAAVAQMVRANDVAVLETMRSIQVSELVPDPDGSPREFLVFKFPITDAEGRRFVGGIALDTTQRRRAEAELRELQKLTQQRERLADIGAIAAQIVHDLGNPLAGISMQAQLLLRRAERDGGQPLHTIRQGLQRILSEAARLDVFIKDFMDFSREQRLNLTAVALPPFLEDIVELWRPLAAARKIALTLSTPGTLPSLTADQHKLRRVFDNLIKNAIEAIDDGPGHVGIDVDSPSPDVVRLLVSDTGPGIPDAVQVFRLFETTKKQGSGIGLAVTKQIVLAHRGKIEVARREPHGTVFRIELPVSGPIQPIER